MFQAKCTLKLNENRYNIWSRGCYTIRFASLLKKQLMITFFAVRTDGQ